MRNEEPMSNPSNLLSLSYDWFYFGFYYGNLGRVIVLLMAGLICSLVFYKLWVGNNFQVKCGSSLELASAASTIEIASEQLTEVMAGCKEYPPASSQDFWQRNLDQEMKNIQQVNPTASVQEKNFTLSQLREVMRRTKEIIRNPGF